MWPLLVRWRSHRSPAKSYCSWLSSSTTRLQFRSFPMHLGNELQHDIPTFAEASKSQSFIETEFQTLRWFFRFNPVSLICLLGNSEIKTSHLPKTTPWWTIEGLDPLVSTVKRDSKSSFLSLPAPFMACLSAEISTKTHVKLNKHRGMDSHRDADFTMEKIPSWWVYDVL